MKRFDTTGVSWTSQVTNMATTYIFMYNIGNAIGAMTMMPAGGALVENDPFSVVSYIIILVLLQFTTYI